MAKFKLLSIPFIALAALGACTPTGSDLERGALGAVIGCAAGEILRDCKCLTGAAVGAAGGALSDDIMRRR
jgi:hypothetical protein